MLGIRVDGLFDAAEPDPGWDANERASLQAAIASRQPFLDFVLTRQAGDGTRQRYQVSGEPMFGPACQFLGYRGIGIELPPVTGAT